MAVGAAAVSNAGNLLRRAESGAVGNGGWTFTGTGRDNEEKSPRRFNVKGKKKGIAAIVTILLLLVGGGTFLGSSNSLLAPAMESLFTEATDTQYTSASLRSRKLFSHVIGGDDITVKNGFWNKTYGKIPGKFKKRLAKQGIEIEGTGKNKVLVFTNESTGKTSRISANDFDAALSDDIDFRKSYNTARRGRVATFFDNIANKIYSKLGISRNLFNNYRQTGDTEIDSKNYRQTMASKFNGGSVELEQPRRETTQIEDPETGEIKTVTTDTVETESSGSTKTNMSDAEVKAKNMIDGFASKVSQVGAGVCTIIKIGNMIAVSVAAMEIYQSINYFMSGMENVSKMKAGYGENSGINEFLNSLSVPAKTEVTNFGSIKVQGTTDNPSTTAETTILNGSPLEANGIQMMLAGAAGNKSTTPSLFSLERVTNSIGMIATSSVGTAAACAGVDIASNLISIGVAIATLGASSVVSAILDFVVGVALGITVSIVLSFLVPTIAQIFFTNIFETATGIPMGELLAKGASASNTRLGRSGSGQSVSGRDAALAYNKVTQEVIAFDAEIDRSTHSPFDISNKNTFLGSIAYSLLPIITSSNITNLATLIRTGTKSLGNILTNVHADGENSKYMTTFGDCPTLKNIGVYGDIYCNPITTTDLTLIDIDPDDTTYHQKIESGGFKCDSNGENCEIDAGSDLGKYITYCDNRDSPFGVVDQNILGSLQFTSGAGTVGGSILNSIPIIGDIFGIIEGIQDEANIPWANGEKCGNTPQNATFWKDQGRYYQRFVEDMRLMEDMGAFQDNEMKNPVTAYEDKYLEEHPLDNSRAGILARISGLTKENAETVLAFVDYYQFINEYDASTRIAVNEDALSTKSADQVVSEIKSQKLHFESSEIIKESEPIVISKQCIIYADIRNRSYTV